MTMHVQAVYNHVVEIRRDTQKLWEAVVDLDSATVLRLLDTIELQVQALRAEISLNVMRKLTTELVRAIQDEDHE